VLSHTFDTKPPNCLRTVSLVIPCYMGQNKTGYREVPGGIQGRQDWLWELLNLCSREFNFLNVSTYRAGAREAKSGSCFSPCHSCELGRPIGSTCFS
jgi:hypothetical protein